MGETPRRSPAQDLRQQTVRPTRGFAALALAVVLASIGLAAGGCSPARPVDTRHGITATYLGRTLSVTLQDGPGVPAVVAAAEGELRSRGYGIEKTQVTSERGRVEALVPRGGPFESVRVLAEVTGTGGVRVDVTWTPLGDVPRSRVVMEGVLERLGVRAAEEPVDGAAHNGPSRRDQRKPEPGDTPTGRPGNMW